MNFKFDLMMCTEKRKKFRKKIRYFTTEMTIEKLLL